MAGESDSLIRSADFICMRSLWRYRGGSPFSAWIDDTGDDLNAPDISLAPSLWIGSSLAICDLVADQLGVSKIWSMSESAVFRVDSHEFEYVELENDIRFAI